MLEVLSSLNLREKGEEGEVILLTTGGNQVIEDSFNDGKISSDATLSSLHENVKKKKTVLDSQPSNGVGLIKR